MEDITDLFISIIRQSPSIDMAEAEFNRTLSDDEQLRRDYRQWCRQQGVTERRGFLDYCEEYWADRNEVWDVLTDYNDDE